MYRTHTHKMLKIRRRSHKERVKKGLKNLPREQIGLDEFSDWLPSWVMSRHLSESELRQPIRGRSL